MSERILCHCGLFDRAAHSNGFFLLLIPQRGRKGEVGKKMGREKWGRRREGSSRPDQDNKHFLARRISYACALKLPYGQVAGTTKAPGEVHFTAHN